jgi:hypothetical protein
MFTQTLTLTRESGMTQKGGYPLNRLKLSMFVHHGELTIQWM